MAVGILQMQQGGKKEQYEQVNEAMFGQSSPRQDQVPEGLIIHSAGPTDDGLGWAKAHRVCPPHV